MGVQLVILGVQEKRTMLIGIWEARPMEQRLSSPI